MAFSGCEINVQVCVASSSFLISFAESSYLFRFQRKWTLFRTESKIQTEVRKRFEPFPDSSLLLFIRELQLPSVIMRLCGYEGCRMIPARGYRCAPIRTRSVVVCDYWRLIRWSVVGRSG
jgi:hypothetical protein